MVLIGLAEALKETPEEKLDPSKARETLYDREIGKAAQPTTVDVNINISLAKRLDGIFGIMEGTAPLLTDGKP
jgi:hypothetical protein